MHWKARLSALRCAKQRLAEFPWTDSLEEATRSVLAEWRYISAHAVRCRRDRERLGHDMAEVDRQLGLGVRKMDLALRAKGL